ncbi:mycofactocin-coupled SDR family oxidoreductase [Amycolatopsis pithecellobii]|uniref:Mycofactocin-coupled SDR family oxidoreductase n=1 Tax=Amycolatopsis pithecellobii TaxID=664692 RepID=A0A6N7YJZ8_9PSEU|nr:mycofactocin-coupled SDR family oxidoreductase [Amycolatopsis pithecellobii]MTD53217.1 mycofactocin-coupled SDR family oxidoreductase [Amycolatopsis pithecellobii]
MTGRLEGKVALVTGAARGQGRSHAIRLAGEGADIIAIDSCTDIATVAYPLSTMEDLDATAAEVAGLGRRIVTAKADIRDLDGLTAAVDQGVAELGGLDAVCANAGICSTGRLTELSAEAWRDMIDVNLTGAFYTLKATVPHLLAGGRGGSIVFTSSSLALRAAPNLGHYTSAKDGLLGLMRTAALELAPHHIRVNSLHPSTVDTPMIHNPDNYRMFLPEVPNPTREQVEPVYQSVNALPHPWVEPIDISHALLYLISDEARYVTGVALPVDLGYALL